MNPAHEHHLPLFHPRLVRDRIKTLDPAIFHQRHQALETLLAHLGSGTLDRTNETELHGGFLEGIFGEVLGYRTFVHAVQDQWDLAAEKRMLKGGSADGAIGFFSGQKQKNQVIAPIELKGPTQFLDHAKGRSLTPIQQGWDYANKTPESRWIIVSNYRETRLYAKSRGQAAYELFLLSDLATEAGFLRFVALLGRDALLGGPSPERSPLSELLVASERSEREITERLYAKYRGLRVQLFEELCRKHSNIPAETLLGYAQTILDRVLFLAFAEDRQLLPSSTIARAYEHRDPYNPRPIWQNFLAVFRSVDKGNPALNIPQYNGGLFTEVPELSDLEVSDEVCAAFRELGEYDFAEDVSVDVLGHIFEQSLTDLEQLRTEPARSSPSATTPALPSTGTQKEPSKRKKEGIFYTPPFVTSYLVRQTLGKTLADAWQRAEVDLQTVKRERIAAWERYRSQLRMIRVLDPACGSGAFLIAAFDALAQEFARVNRSLAELRGEQHQVSLFDLGRSVLNENLFGVDKSAESVEITKLSMWLKTAQYGKKLTFLDRNIRHGNSVVSDAKVDPWAFDWSTGQAASSYLEPAPPAGEDADVIAARWREGFDVVLGNPPYVRQELLTAYKDHWRSTFQVFDGTADLFVYFFERGLARLKVGGRLGFIVSNKWLRGGYAEKLRAHFATQTTVESLVDFGHAPIFPDADAFPCILTLRKLRPRENHAVYVTQYPREELGKEILASYIESHEFPLPQADLQPQGWTLEPPGVQALLQKLRTHGTPLGEYIGGKPYRGVLTGCNEAFLIDQKTKERLCREDPRSAEVLKKYLRGQDIARWSPEWASLWILVLKSSANHAWPWSQTSDEAAAEQVFARTYPALHRFLKPLEATLRKRTDKGRFWWELRACAYYESFDKPKLLYPDIMWRADFCVAPAGIYINNTTYLLPKNDLWVLACLNSPVLWSYLWRTAQHAKDEALRMFSDYLVTVPISSPSQEQLDLALPAIEQSVALTTDIQSACAGVLDLLRMEYEVSEPGRVLSDFARLGSDDFVREVKKRRDKTAPALSVAALKALRALHDSEVPAVQEKRAQLLQHEHTLATAVHAAYQLTEEDLSLLRATQPPRMPPGL